MKSLLNFLLLGNLLLSGCLGCGGGTIKQREIPDFEESVLRDSLYQAYQLAHPKVKPMESVPVPERYDFGISSINEVRSAIYFTADSITIKELNLSRFGNVHWLDVVEGVDKWCLYVDARYVFTEVVAYLQSKEHKKL